MDLWSLGCSTEIIFSASVKLPTYEKACNDIPFATPNDDEQNNTDDAPQQVIFSRTWPISF